MTQTNESTEQWINTTVDKILNKCEPYISQRQPIELREEITEALRRTLAATQQREGEIRAEAFKAGAASAYYCFNGIGEFDSAKHKADEAAYLEQFKGEQKEKS